ncbi:MAG TPA: glycosyltransferase family 1 protein [Acidimicrobiales bacterium]
MNGTTSRSTTRIGVNLLWLVPGVVGGSEDYAVRLLRALTSCDHAPFELVLFTLRQFPDAHPDLAGHYTVVTAPIDGSVKPLRVLAESTWLAAQARRRRIDMFHHVGGRVPLVSPVPSLVTIHDLQPLDMPGNFSVVKRLFLARALPRSAARATVVATPSGFVRDGVVRRLGVPPERCRVVSAPRRDRSELHLTRSTPAVASVLDDATPFFVYPAITYRHKNHATLLDAYAALHRSRPDVRLVLTGGEGPEEAAVRARIDALGIAKSVVRTGRIPRSDLDALIAHATALVFPSRYEGFGIPVLEAMAAGCPVIAADATSLPEVVGSAGTLVDPDDVAGWTAAMAAHLDAPRDELAAKGRERAELYSPAACVDALLQAYESVFTHRGEG